MNYAKQFYVYRLEENNNKSFIQQQADYYSISLLTNNTPGQGTMLCFCNPHAHHTGGSPENKKAGFSCMFNTAFLSHKMQGTLDALPMFRKGANPVYFLNTKQENSIRALFEKMLEEVNNNYTFKYELLGNYLAEIIHHAFKIQPDTNTCSQVTQICTDQ